jgi:hypothetical protein
VTPSKLEEDKMNVNADVIRSSCHEEEVADEQRELRDTCLRLVEPATLIGLRPSEWQDIVLMSAESPAVAPSVIGPEMRPAHADPHLEPAWRALAFLI